MVGDRLFLLSNEGVEKEIVQALRVEDGQGAWTTTIGKVGNPKQQPNYPAARSTPTVDGDRLYALGSDGDLACLETATGKIVWRKNLRADFEGQPGTWAYAESPLIDGEQLICAPGGTNATVIALNKKTGEPIWKSAVPGGDQAAYASAVKADIGGVQQYIQFLQNGVVALEAKSGKFLWRYGRTAKGSPANIPTPVARDGFVYSAGGTSGGGLVKVTASQGEWTTEPVYFSAKLPTSIGGAVEIGGYLYGTTGQALLCVEFATGKVKWSDRSVGAASICYADGCLYLHSERGDLALVEANPEAYHELGRFSLPDQPERGASKAWSYPVVANGRLYVRDLGSLWCYQVGADGK